MKILSQVNHLIFKLNHSLIIKLSILQSHLLLHEQHCVDVLILFIIIPQFLSENFSLLQQLVNGFKIGSHIIDFPQCSFIKMQIFSQIVEIMFAFDSLSLQKLNFVFLCLVSYQDLLNIAHVIVFHLNYKQKDSCISVLTYTLLNQEHSLLIFFISYSRVTLIQYQMQADIFDYRNGKYQGPINSLKQRHGLGIFIDDDLTFHISHWLNNKLNGPTLVYLTHGKYIYGEWKMNEPHGLNIYRSGDTVLLSKFKQGKPSERCLLIFQKYNFACVLTDQNGEWRVIKGGPLPNHKVLVKYIEQIGLPFPEHYFSLTKFACAFSNNGKIKIFPCKTNFCYFGLINGLGIVFNSNNGVVSVGHHQNQEISQFGGRYSGVKKAEEGNFETGEVISYTGERPTSKIYAIFQSMHKKSLNFCNEYFDSKSRVFSTIQAILQNKLNDIAQEGRKSQDFRNINLNDSLNYKEYDDQQSFRMNENRQRMYSPPKKTMIRSQSNLQRTSNCVEESKNNRLNFSKCNKSPIKQSTNKQKQQNEVNYVPRPNISPYRFKKDEFSEAAKYLPEDNKKYFRRNPQPKISQQEMKAILTEKLESRTKSCYQIERNKLQDSQPRDRFDELTFQNIRLPITTNPYVQNKKKYLVNQPTKREYSAISKIHKFEGLIDERRLALHQQQIENLQQTSSFQKRQLKNFVAQTRPKEEDNLQQKTSSPNKILRKQSTIKKPSYEEIEQRRKRLLRDFKQLNEENISGQKVSKIKQSPVKWTQDIITPSQSRESSCGFIPLSISNKINKKSTADLQKTQKQVQKPNKNNYTPVKMENSIKERNYNDENKVSTLLYSYEEQKHRVQKQNPAKNDLPRRNTTLTQNNLTPSKQKRTYQYVFE